MTSATRTWLDLPAALRTRVESVLGADIHGFQPARGGYTVGGGGILGVVQGSNGDQLFVKALQEGNPAADDLLIEVRVGQALPTVIPTPRLRLVTESESWRLIAFDALAGHPAHEPWRPQELAATLDALTISASALTPAPTVELPTVVERMAGRYGTWQDLAAHGRSGSVFADSLGAWERRRLDRLAECEERWPSLASGSTLLHFDLRHDNCIIDPSGTASFIDWGRACLGVAWMDLVCLLLESDLGDREEQAIFQSHLLGQDANSEALDAFLAVLASYWTAQASLPPEAHAPHLRSRQRYSQTAALRWLAARWS